MMMVNDGHQMASAQHPDSVLFTSCCHRCCHRCCHHCCHLCCHPLLPPLLPPLPPLLPPLPPLLPPLLQGLMMYDDIFDGKFTPMLAAAGANMTTNHKGIIFHHPATGSKPWLRNIPLCNGELPAAFCTRHLFETSTRKLVMENPKVDFKYGVTVAGLQIKEQESGSADGPDKHVTGKV
jgi:hypothetical protein